MQLFWVVLFLVFTLLSCSDNDNSRTELQTEYDLIKASTAQDKPKVVKPQELPQGPLFKQGQDYEVLKVPYATENTEQVVVYEFFGYTCPHCFYFEPFMEEWLKTKPEYVKLVRVP